ncbi:hypothetical protein RJZ56_000523 [Blastomyces dermatitidis]
MNCPKMNPSRRVFTPEGQVSWGGSCMALHNVESPGGYQLTGLSIPGVDILGSKAGYSPEKPWSYEDFDQISSYKVTEEEYERGMAQFRSGRYEYKWEHVEFDMAEHNRLLGGTKDEVAKIRATAASAAPLKANVWKIEVKDGDKIAANQVVTILEAMKLEITVQADPSTAGGVVEEILVKPNDSIEAGKPLMLVRMGGMA